MRSNRNKINCSGDRLAVCWGGKVRRSKIDQSTRPQAWHIHSAGFISKKILLILPIIIVLGGIIWWSIKSTDRNGISEQQTVINGVETESKVLSAEQRKKIKQARLAKEKVDLSAEALAKEDWAAILNGKEREGRKESFRARREALVRLLTRANEQDIEAMYAFLADSKMPENLSVLQTNALKNLIMDFAVEKDPDNQRVEKLFTQILENPQTNEVTRDYIVQHLDSVSGSSKTTERIKNILWKNAERGNSGTSGTALLTLRRMQREGSDGESLNVSKEKLQATALKTVKNPKANVQAQITAWQVIESNNQEIRKSALQVAQNEKAATPLRASAIAALGRVGGPEEKVYLERLVKEDQYPFNLAAKRALEKMNELKNNKVGAN